MYSAIAIVIVEVVTLAVAGVSVLVWGECTVFSLGGEDPTGRYPNPPVCNPGREVGYILAILSVPLSIGAFALVVLMLGIGTVVSLRSRKNAPNESGP